MDIQKRSFRYNQEVKKNKEYNMMHNHILNGMDGESGMAVGTFDVRPGLNTLYDGLYGPRTVAGTAHFENRNSCNDPEEHYANDIEM